MDILIPALDERGKVVLVRYFPVESGFGDHFVSPISRTTQIGARPFRFPIINNTNCLAVVCTT